MIAQLDALKLYSISGVDWHVSVSHCLTEPTCPTVTIQPEGWHLNRYRYDRDTIEEAVAAAVEHVRTEIGEKRVLGIAAPWTNGDDSIFERWLRGYVDGSTDKLPPPPPRPVPPSPLGDLVTTVRELRQQVVDGSRNYEGAFGYLHGSLERSLLGLSVMTPGQVEDFEKQMHNGES